jgi:hypothetical protein
MPLYHVHASYIKQGRHQAVAGGRGLLPQVGWLLLRDEPADASQPGVRGPGKEGRYLPTWSHQLCGHRPPIRGREQTSANCRSQRIPLMTNATAALPPRRSILLPRPPGP